jgi:hypothetical protein
VERWKSKEFWSATEAAPAPGQANRQEHARGALNWFRNQLFDDGR